jgi:hypothetical protein
MIRSITPLNIFVFYTCLGIGVFKIYRGMFGSSVSGGSISYTYRKADETAVDAIAKLLE